MTAETQNPTTTPRAERTVYLTRPDGRVAYHVAGEGPIVVLVPGMGDLRDGYRFLAPVLRDAGYRVACTDRVGTARATPPSAPTETVRLRATSSP